MKRSIETITDQIRIIIQEELEITKFDENKTPRDLGIDSFDEMGLALEVEDFFDVEINYADAAILSKKSIKEWAEFIHKKLNGF